MPTGQLTTGNAGAQSGGGGGLSKVYEVDLTAQPTQALATDGVYTIAGLPWTKGNSVNDQSPAELLNGTGIVIQPAATSDYNGVTRTLPYVELFLSALALPLGFAFDSRMRLWVSFEQNDGADYDNAVAAIDHNDVTTFGYVGKYGYGTGGIGSSVQLNYNSTNNGFSNRINALASPATMVLELPSGLMSSVAFLMLGAGYSAGAWPSLGSLLAGPATFLNAPTSSVGAFAGTNLADSWGIMLGAQRAGSATALAIAWQRMKLEVAL